MMPTMAQYAASGGYAKDAKISSNISASKSSSSTPKVNIPSSSNSGSSSSSSYSPPSYSQSYSPPPTPSTPKVNIPQAQLPSWMGNMYKPVVGTNMYSTDPSNPNSNKFTADGRPVATVGYDNQQTGQSYHGYATPEQFSQITSGGSSSQIGNILSGMVSSGQLNTPQSSIYNPSGGYAKMPMSASQATASQNTGMPSAVNYPGMNSNVSAPPPPSQLTSSQRSAQDWINNQASGQGGYQNYIKGQQTKYDAAIASGDKNMLNNLNTDMSRVGYSLNMPKAQPSSSGSSGFGMPQRYNDQPGQAQTGQPQGVQSGMGQTPNFGQTTNGGFFPTGNPYTGPTPAQIAADAAGQMNRQITDRTRIADQTKAGYQTSYDRMNSATKDNRNLENFANSQLLNPFNGFSDYTQGQIARERATTDREGQQDLQTRLGGVDAQLADFLNQTPDMQQKIINDMTQQERAYFLQTNAQALQAQNQQFSQGMANKQFDQQSQNQQFNQGIAQKQLDQQSQHQQFTQEQSIKQQHIDLASMLSQQFGVLVNPTEDPMMSYAQVAQLQPLAAKKLSMDAQQMTFDNAIKKALAENTITQTQAGILNDAQQLGLQTEKFHSDVDQSLFDSMTKAGQTPKGADVSSISTNINRGISSMGDNFDLSTPQGKQQIESMIITQTNDPKVAVPLYNMYGIPVPPQLQKEYEQSLKANQ
jgi:hypothetical protein